MATPAPPVVKTPADYHRILSPSLKVPTDPAISVPGGLLACQRDPSLTSLETFVVNVTESKPPPKSGKRQEPAQGPQAIVILHDTILFPEGGGQPSDTGFITANQSGAQPITFRVAKVAGGEIGPLHSIELEGDFNNVAQILKPGVAVTVWLGAEDLERRHDHMTVHTAQHLLSAVLEHQFGLDTLSWGMRAYPSPSYVEIPRHLTRDEIAAVQAETQKHVLQGKRVHVEVQVRDGLEAPAQLTAADVHRVVVIDGVDSNPCCGTHLPSTNNLQVFLLPTTESIARGASGSSARLYFLAGARLLAHLGSTHDLLSKSATILSCGLPQVPDRVTQVVDDRKELDSYATDLETELAGHIARGLVRDLRAAPLASTDSDTAVSKICTRLIHRIDERSPLKFLQSIITSFSDHIPTEQGGYKGPYIFVIVSRKATQSATTVATIVACGSEAGLVQKFGTALKSRLGVKGGGSGLRWSGKFTGVWKEGEHSRVVETLFREV